MKIPLKTWGDREFSPTPTPATLRQWAKSGKISPPPIKIGRSYYVEDSASISNGQTDFDPAALLKQAGI